MIKENKTKIILSSIITLLPILAGLILWNKLPEIIPTHWGVNGEANGFSSRGTAVFGIPITMLIVHLICISVTAADPKNKGQNKKISSMILWIAPIASVFCSAVIYATALGMKLRVDSISMVLLGLMFIILGNYLPKCKQNYTIGVKVPWALNDEANWNATHRFCGKLWVIGGILFLACVFLPENIFVYVMLVIIVILAIVPVIYSYLYYKKHN